MPLQVALLTTQVCQRKFRIKVKVRRGGGVLVETRARARVLPTQVRPVLSKVRPSTHSQRKEPCVLTQRPLVHTPGNTSHSLMSVGESTGAFLPRGRFTSQELLATCFYLRRRAPSYEQTPESRRCLRRPEEVVLIHCLDPDLIHFFTFTDRSRRVRRGSPRPPPVWSSTRTSAWLR